MSVLLRASFRAVQRPSLSLSPSLSPSLLSIRSMSQDSGSHSDFMPKKKANVPEGMDEVLKLIDKQVKENDILLYMKGEWYDIMIYMLFLCFYQSTTTAAAAAIHRVYHPYLLICPILL